MEFAQCMSAQFTQSGWGPPSRALGGALIKAREPVLLTFKGWRINVFFDVFNKGLFRWRGAPFYYIFYLLKNIYIIVHSKRGKMHVKLSRNTSYDEGNLF